jgi:hypothetical protein
LFRKKQKRNNSISDCEFGTAKTQAAEEQQKQSYLNKPAAVGNRGNQRHKAGWQGRGVNF